jgi:hypothetical protein
LQTDAVNASQQQHAKGYSFHPYTELGKNMLTLRHIKHQLCSKDQQQLTYPHFGTELGVKNVEVRRSSGHSRP